MTVIVGESCRPLLAQSLAAQEINVLWMPPNSHVDPRLACHVDLSFIRREGAVVCSRGLDPLFVNYITNRGYLVSIPDKPAGERYPQDAGLCALDTGRYLICNYKIVDPTILQLFSDRVLVPVAQGYTRCSATIVNEHSIITADAGVSRAAKHAGLDVLDIEASHVELSGFSYGFIGGASFLLKPDTLVFTGMLDAHPDKNRILAFFLAKGALIDIGGAITLP